MDKREKQARAEALKIALRQTDAEALAHLESVVGAILLSMNSKERGQVMEQIDSIEAVPSMSMSVSDVQLHGEVDAGVTPKRQAWRDELAGIEAELQAEPDMGEVEEEEI